MFDLERELSDTIISQNTGYTTRAQVMLGHAGLHAVSMHQASAWCLLQGWTCAAQLIANFSGFMSHIDIAPGARLGRRVVLSGTGIVIGSGAVIGDGVTVCAGVKIAAGVTVGEGAVIGANAVIEGPVAAGAVIPPLVHILAEDAAEVTDEAAAGIAECSAAECTAEEVPAEDVPAEEGSDDAAEVTAGETADESAETVAAAPADERSAAALKELVRVTREQNAVIEKLNAEIVRLGGTSVTELPRLNAAAVGMNTRRARHHRRKPRQAPQTPAA